MTPLPTGLLMLLVLAMPIAAIAWTVTHEDIFREPRDYFVKRSEDAKSLVARKFFYLLTCEYCFSHWVTLGVLLLTGFRLLYDDWRGYARQRLLAGVGREPLHEPLRTAAPGHPK